MPPRPRRRVGPFTGLPIGTSVRRRYLPFLRRCPDASSEGGIGVFLMTTFDHWRRISDVSHRNIGTFAELGASTTIVLISDWLFASPPQQE
jgi:hypothetical protein